MPADEEETILMGCWDCPICGHTGIMGDVRECPSCENARREDVRFYLPKDAKALTSDADLKEAKAGADWYCLRCSAGNSALDDECHACHTLKEVAENYSMKKSTTDDPNDDDASGTREHIVSEGSIDKALGLVAISPVVPSNRTSQRLPRSPRRKAPANRSFLTLILGVTVTTVAIPATIYYLFSSEEIPAKITSHSWERHIDLDICRTVSETDWSVPSRGRQTGSFQAIHHYDRVIDGYRQVSYQERVQDGYRTETYTERYQTGSKRVASGTTTKSLGNGRFRRVTRYTTVPTYGTRTRTRQVPKYKMVTKYRQEPVYKRVPRYATKYKYDIEKWVHFRTESESGEKDPIWPDISRFGLSDTLHPGNVRVSNRKQNYKLHFVSDEGKSYSFSTNQSTWERYKDGDRIIATVNRLTVESIAPDPNHAPTKQKSMVGSTQ